VSPTAATTLGERLRGTFEVIDEPETVIPGTELAGRTWRDRYRAWRKSLPAEQRAPRELLLPRVERSVTVEEPAYMARHVGHVDLTPAELQAMVDGLGAWTATFPLRHGVRTTPDTMEAAVERVHRLFRRDLIGGTVADLLGDELGATTILDVGCNSGYFSFDLATRGAAHVDGVDLRDENIAQARFLAEHYGIDNVSFEVSDAEADVTEGQWDVVLNLGLLYHVTQPLALLRQTYDWCRRFAVIDTVCTLEPFSGYIVVGDRDVDRPVEGRAEIELHPTYRGAIDTIAAAGFSEVFEITGTAEEVPPAYASGSRRCFLAVK
jgi:SAM-dependent methyltransferase